MNRKAISEPRLNELMENPNGNRQEIFLALYRLAVLRAKAVNFRSFQDRQDAISEAVIYAINKIGSYNPQRRAAVTYFGRLLSRRMHFWLRSQEKHKAVHEKPGEVEHHQKGSLFDRAAYHGSLSLPHKPRAGYQIAAPGEREKVRRLLDLALGEAHAVIENSTDEQEMQRGQIALSVLQQIRKRLLGRFNRISSDHDNSAQAA